MQNSGNGTAKLIITFLAIVCVVLIVVFIVKNKPECTGSAPVEPAEEYSDYNEDYSVSDGDITFDDNNTEEMDTIPNDASSPSSTDAN